MSRRNPKDQARPVDIQRMFDREPPAAPGVEASLLCCLMLDSRAVGDAQLLLPGPEAFSSARHSAIYEAILALNNAGRGTAPTLVAQYLRDQDLFEKVGGAEYLIKLTELLPSAAGAEHYAREIREKHIAREVIAAAGRVLDDAYNGGHSAQELMDRASRHIFAVCNHRTSDAEEMNSIMARVLEKIERRQPGVLGGLPTGFTELNEYLDGLHPGHFTVIAARPSMGKTAFMMSMAEHLAYDHQEPVAVFSLEMGRDGLGQRTLCGRAGVESQRVRTGWADAGERLRLRNAAAQSSRMVIDDTPGISAAQLRVKARRLVLDKGVKAVFVDYLQLMGERGFPNRQEEVSYISRQLKALARELHVPLVVLAQINRKVEDRADNRPRMSDLRESGAIEQDADNIMLLHREDYYHKGEDAWLAANPHKIGVTEVIIDKQREGPVGSVFVKFNAQTTSFHDRTLPPQKPLEAA